MVNETSDQPDYEFDWQNPNYSKPQYQVGRVLSRTFAGVFTQWKPILVAFICFVALQVLLGLLSFAITGQTGLEDDIFSNSNAVIYIIVSIISTLFIFVGFVFIMIVTDAAVYSKYTNQQQTMKALLQKGLKKCVPLFFGGVFFIFAYLLGSLFFLIPGLFIYFGWGIFGPIYVNEDKPLTESFGRSWGLMQGYKRWFFLASIIMGILIYIVLVVLIVIFVLIYGTILYNPESLEEMSLVSSLIFSLVFVVIFILPLLFQVSFTTANYLEVKELKEGTLQANTAAIFS